MIKKLLLILAICLATNICAGKPLEKLTVALDWFPNPEHAPLIIANQQGYFREQGLDVTLIHPTHPNDTSKWVAAGKANIGITYEPELLEQIDTGRPIIRLGTLIDKPLTSLVALQTADVNSITDLKGKRIGTSNQGLSTIVLKTMLAKAGISAKEIEIVKMSDHSGQALLTHTVDAVTDVMRNSDVPRLERNHQKLLTFFPEDNGIPTYSELVFIINTDDKKDTRFPRFLTAIKKAVRFLDAHPQLAWQNFVKAYPISNTPLNREMWFSTIPYFAEDPASFDSQEWLHFADFMHKNKLIKKVQPISRYTINS